VIGVGATDETDAIGPFSGTGSYVDVVAPGVDIWVLGPDGYATSGDGTSYASPYAAALAAQLLAVRPGLTPASIETVLTTTARDLGPVGRDNTFGHGIIRPLDALCAVGVCGADDLVSRLAGTDRFATAAEIARQFPADGEVVYVANGQQFPDALAGAALAGSRGAPVVLVRSNSIPSSTAAALSELRPQRIVVLGGGQAVDTNVVQALRHYATATSGTKIRRVAGTDRYATAAAIAAEFPAGGEVVYVASGQNFPDALAGAALAGSQGAPVVLVRSNGVPFASAEALARLQPQRIVVLGGAVAVGDQVLEQLRGYASTGEVTRLSGVDRYATAAAVAAQFPPERQVLYVASGQDFPDALAGAALAGSRGTAVVLVRPDGIPSSTVAALDRLDPERAVILGGIVSVSQGVARGLAAYVK
jgi:putative cell wall-binding protein